MKHANIVNDPVNHPSHYTDGKIEVIDYIEDKHLGFNLGNAVKYISRAGKKNPEKTIEDLEKARWYVNREISRLVRECEESNQQDTDEEIDSSSAECPVIIAKCAICGIRPDVVTINADGKPCVFYLRCRTPECSSTIECQGNELQSVLDSWERANAELQDGLLT